MSRVRARMKSQLLSLSAFLRPSEIEILSTFKSFSGFDRELELAIAIDGLAMQ